MKIAAFATPGRSHLLLWRRGPYSQRHTVYADEMVGQVEEWMFTISQQADQPRSIWKTPPAAIARFSGN